MSIRLSHRHLLAGALLLGCEIAIGTLLHDRLIRAYGGDVLVLPLLYCLILSAYQPARPQRLAVGLLLFACGVELAQYFAIADLLGFTDASLWRTLIGTHGDALDILAYLAGYLLITQGQRWHY